MKDPYLYALKTPERLSGDHFAVFRRLVAVTVDSTAILRCWEDKSVLIFVRRGTGSIFINLEETRIRPGYIAALYPCHVFSLRADSEAPLELEVLFLAGIDLAYSIFSEADEAEEAGGQSPWPNCFLLPEEKQRKMQKLFDLYGKEQEKNEFASDLIRQSLAHEAFELFSEEAGEYARTHTRPPVERGAEIFLYLWANRRKPLTAAGVAKQFGITVSRLNSVLRQICGNSFPHVLSRARIVGAYPVVFQQDVSFRSLAIQTGFPSEKTFQRSFSAFVGESPQKFRHRLCAKEHGTVHNLVGDKLIGILLYIYQNYTEAATINDCARELFLSLEAINSLLKLQYGAEAGFNSLMTGFKLQFSAGLLTMGDLSVLDIAFLCGFNSVHTFIRLFKARFGMTPAKYRQNFRQKGRKGEDDGGKQLLDGHRA